MIKIDKIKIQGFKKIKKAEVELSPGANLLLGHNEMGKSSLEDAIRYALTDAIQGQPKGAFTEAINDQCKTASVVITGQAGTEPFQIKRTLASTNRSGPSPVQIGAQLGVDPVILSACLSANYYFDLSPDYQKKLIIKALGLKPTRVDAMNALEEKGYADSDEERAWNEDIVEEIGSLDWDAGYRMAYDLRREAGQEIKTLKGNQPQLITQVSMDGKDVPIDAIMESHEGKPLEEQEKVYKIRLKELQEELGGIKALSNADKEIAEKQLEICRTEEAKRAKEPKWTGEDSAKAKQLKIAKKKFDAKTKEDVATLENLIEAAEKTLADNKKNWESNLKCPIPDESGHAMCPAIEPSWAKHQQEIDNLETKIKVIEEKQFPDQDTWDTLAKKASTCKDNIAHKKILEKDIEELEEKLENAAPETGEKKEALEISIEVLEKKIEHLRLGQSALTWNQATQKTLDATQTKIDEAETRREHYDALCKLLAPDGIPGELIAEKLGTLNARLEEHAKMIGVSIQFLDDLILVQGDKKQLWTLGGAETSRVRMAVAEALSFITGVGLLLIDECNISVAQDSARVRKWLVDIGQTTQIIAAAATNAAGPPSVPKNSPVRIFWIENGSIKKL
jgi:hypothetical protein